MMFDFSRGTLAQVFCIRIYGDHSDAWWHKAFILPIYRVGRRIRDAIWWLRYRFDPKHRYHLIDTHLSPDYYDIDTLMLNGMFSLLRRYVEEEHEGADGLERWGKELLSDAGFMQESSTRQGNKELEAVALYRWWMESRPAMVKRSEELLHTLYGKRRRITFSEASGGLHQMHISPFEGDEIALKQEMDDLEARIDREDGEMLHRLIDIRGGLWT